MDPAPHPPSDVTTVSTDLRATVFPARGADAGLLFEPVGRGRHGLSPQVVLLRARERLQAATVALVAAGGFSAASVARLCATARISKATFYQLYPDTDALVHATWAEQSRRLIASAVAEPTAEAAVRAVLDLLDRHPPASRFVLVDGQRGGVGLDTVRMTRLRVLARALARGRSAVVADQAFTAVMIVYHGVAHQVRVGCGRLPALADDVIAGLRLPATAG